MAVVEVTDATDANEEVTQVEEPVATESEDQDSANKLSLIEVRLAELEESRKLEAKARADAESKWKEAEERATAKEREYKGLQRETGQKTNELKVLREQLQNQNITQDKLDRMEKLVKRLAQVQMSPEEIEDIDREMAAERDRLELARLKEIERQARTQREQAGQRRLQILTPEQKQQYIEAYFEDFGVGPEELTDEEWAAGVFNTPPEWARHIRSVMEKKRAAKLRSETPVQSTDDIKAEIRAALKAELEAERLKDKEAQVTATEEIKTLRIELEEAKRLAEEAANRAKGMDRQDRSPSSSASRKAVKTLNEIPDEWLYGTAAEKKAYSEAVNSKSLRAEIMKKQNARS